VQTPRAGRASRSRLDVIERMFCTSNAFPGGPIAA
jgi:hypothetical protein